MESSCSQHNSPECHTSFVISFSGIDGAGKTTQINNLVAWLQAAGLRVRLVRFWDDVSLLTGFRESLGHALFRGDKGVGARSKPVRRRDKNVRNWYMTPVRLAICSLDALGLSRALARFRRRQDADVVIFDRYLYDQLANLNQENRLVRMFMRGLLRSIPSPDIAYLIDAIPEQARERKPEYPLEFLRLNRAHYMTLSDIAGLTVIPSGTPENVSACIQRHAAQRLALSQHEPVHPFLTSRSR